jgi:polyhydroxyalkanoate synthesis regulator phasin
VLKVELLKKGIVIGLGAHDMSKKQIEDFVKKLQINKIIDKNQYAELVNLITERKAKLNEHLNSRIENFIQTQLKKEELATMNHIEYLEKRIDLLEEEVYNLLLERYIEDVDDKEISELLKDLDIKQTKTEKVTKTKETDDHFFDSDWLDSEELYDDLIKSENNDLKDLLYLPKEEEGKMFGKKKKVVAKKAAPKKPAVKKKVAAKKPTVKKVAKKPVKKAAVKKPVAAKKPAVKKKTTKKAKK